MVTFRPFSTAALPGAAAVLLALACLTLPWARHLERGLLDRHFRLSRQLAPRPAPGPEVVIVGIDEATLQAIPEPTALYHRPLGRFLQAMAQAQPKAVGLDFVLPERSLDNVLPGTDQALMRGIFALKGHVPLVLGRMLGAGGLPRPIHPPLAALAGERSLGFVLVPLDGDQVARRFQPWLDAEQKGVTFAARLAEACGRPAPAMLIDYTLGPAFVPVSLQEVLRWQEEGRSDLLRARFQGRVVLLGTVLPYEDRINLPVRLAAWENPTLTGAPGVLLHAQALRTLLAGTGIRSLAPWLVFTLGLAGALGGLSLAGTRRGWAWLLGLLVLVEAAAFLLLRHGLYLPVVASAGPAAAAWLLAGARERLRDRQARREAETAARAQADFLARMSHEIRTPMNAILGLARLAQRQHPAPGTADYLGKIVGASRLLMGILNDVLDFSKIEAGRMELEAVPFEPAELLARLEDLFAAQAQFQGLAWQLSLGPDVPPVLVGDPLRLGQVLANLVGNALKFTQAGRVQVAVTLIAHGPDRAALCFAVTDTGIGLAPAEQERIFQPFSQADASINRRFGGSGLGLAIAQHLVSAMGGELTVASQPGQGSTFSFTASFPLGVLATPTPVLPASGLQGLRVLLVEDDLINQEVAREILQGAGAQVFLAATGLEGVQLALTAAPHVVLMDLHMPDLDGLEAARRIWTQHQELPIVALTADAMPQTMEACRRAGMTGVLLKPFEPEALVQTLAAFLTPAPATPPAPVTAPAVGALPTPPEPAALPELPGIALQAALRRLGGNQVLLRQLLALFRERYAQEAEIIRLGLATDDRERVLLRLHTLKGAAASLSATPLFKACQRLENSLRLQDEPAFPDCLAALTQELAQTLSSCLAAQVPGLPALAPDPQPPAQLPQPPQSKADLASLRQELARELRLCSPDAEFAAARLRTFLADTPQQASMLAIEQHIQRFNYQAALRELELSEDQGLSAAPER